MLAFIEQHRARALVYGEGRRVIYGCRCGLARAARAMHSTACGERLRYIP